jgi:hypothetical protein
MIAGALWPLTPSTEDGLAYASGARSSAPTTIARPCGPLRPPQAFGSSKYIQIYWLQELQRVRTG